jgi:hypothetical protein
MIVTAIIQEADATNPLCSFLVKNAKSISWALSCFDRVIFKGHLPISRPTQFEYFVDSLKIRGMDFLKVQGPEWSERLVEHAKRYAEEHSRSWEYRTGNIDKDAWAKEQLACPRFPRGLSVSCA